MQNSDKYIREHLKKHTGHKMSSNSQKLIPADTFVAEVFSVFQLSETALFVQYVSDVARNTIFL